MTEPTSGFSQTEFEARTGLTQQLMHAANLDAILVTTEAEIRYYTGFHTQFFESPTRPWFLVIPAEGKPIGGIVELSSLMQQWHRQKRERVGAGYSWAKLSGIAQRGSNDLPRHFPVHAF